MKKIVVISLTILLLGVESAFTNDEFYDDGMLGIVNGRPADRSITKYQVFLVIKNIYGPRWCSGTLISKNYVLTSAYCLDKASEVEARLGVYNRTDDEENSKNKIMAESFHQHEDFSMDAMETPMKNDIGLVKLKTPAPDEFEPVQFADASKDANGTISGWGLNSSTGDSSTVLMEAAVKVIDNVECIKKFAFLDNKNVCTIGDSGEGFCIGDQGGPLMVGDKQIGITSFGDQECRAGYPTYYTRISSYLKWIKKNSYSKD